MTAGGGGFFPGGAYPQALSFPAYTNGGGRGISPARTPDLFLPVSRTQEFRSTYATIHAHAVVVVVYVSVIHVNEKIQYYVVLLGLRMPIGTDEIKYSHGKSFH